MTTFTLTPLQTQVLDEVTKRRLTVVRAGPGSGKTRVFVEALRRELQGWTSHRAGVAALSFTNVAHEVVTARLGAAPPAPHFIGTIDAFFLRFAVLPFGKTVGLTAAGARLIPDPVAKSLGGLEIQYGTEAWQKATVFQFSFSGGDEDAPSFSVKEGHGITKTLYGQAAKRVLDAKKREWAKHGRITHSDSQYLASKILKSPLADRITLLVTTRFPVMLVDEFQDTGWFLGRALAELLARVRRGLVVGDPDQAIYQFAGSDRELFDKLEAAAGTDALLLNESHRCSERVASVASALSRSKKRVVARADAPKGQTLLVVYAGPSVDPAGIVDAIEDRLSDKEHQDLVLLSRKAPKTSGASDPWGGGTPGRICNAVAALRAGDARSAAHSLSRELVSILICEGGPTAATLDGAGIKAREWDYAVAHLLLRIECSKSGESWNQWIVRVRGEVEHFAKSFSLDAGSLGSRLKKDNKGGDAARDLDRKTANVSKPATATVHSVKGQEFGAVVFLVQPPHKKNAPCPSTTWWAEDPEEREIAYVACSRAKTILCLAVHDKTYRALLTEQAGFIGLFDVVHLPSNPGEPTKKPRGRGARPGASEDRPGDTKVG